MQILTQQSLCIQFINILLPANFVQTGIIQDYGREKIKSLF